jgi:secreted trypsin-like serine protease
LIFSVRFLPCKSGWTAAGIVSFGFGCAEADTPAVYTNVAYFHNWISSFVQNMNGENCGKSAVNPLWDASTVSDIDSEICS